MRPSEPSLAYRYVESPVGRMLIAGDAAAVHLISFAKESAARLKADWRRDDGLLAAAAGQLERYFSGELTEFDLSLKFSGTPFQNKVWAALRAIPFGTTISYGELAAHIGKPTASRAVGAANGANRLPLVVPCHRVIGADGSLTGFGGGLDTKRFLLAHEQKVRRKHS